jgi:hypothetical protein
MRVFKWPDLRHGVGNDDAVLLEAKPDWKAVPPEPAKRPQHVIDFGSSRSRTRTEAIEVAGAGLDDGSVDG